MPPDDGPPELPVEFEEEEELMEPDEEEDEEDKEARVYVEYQ